MLGALIGFDIKRGDAHLGPPGRAGGEVKNLPPGHAHVLHRERRAGTRGLQLQSRHGGEFRVALGCAILEHELERTHLVEGERSGAGFPVDALGEGDGGGQGQQQRKQEG